MAIAADGASTSRSRGLGQVLRGDPGPRRRLGRDPRRHRPRLRRRERGRQVHPRQDHRRASSRQDQGELVLRGTTVSFRSPREALVRGIALVAQEVAARPAADRRRERLPRRRAATRRVHRPRRAARAVRSPGRRRRASTSGPAPSSGQLPLAKQQQVEILRALARDADLIVLDEPSASLSAKEVERLHEIVRGAAPAAVGRSSSSRIS